MGVAGSQLRPPATPLYNRAETDLTKLLCDWMTRWVEGHGEHEPGAGGCGAGYAAYDFLRNAGEPLALKEPD